VSAATCPAGSADNPCSHGGKVKAKGLCQRHYRQTPEQKAAKRAYHQSPEYKAAERARYQTPEYKAARRARRSTPEQKAAKRAYRQTPERKAYGLAYRQTPERKAAQRAYDRAHNSTTERKAYLRVRRLRTSYGITLAGYDALLARGPFGADRCWNCGTTEAKGPHGVFNVDHDSDHPGVSRGVRGILCDPCNRRHGEGNDMDTIEGARRWLAYLENGPARVQSIIAECGELAGVAA